MRIRTKECFNCNDQKEVLFRCRYDELKDWDFLFFNPSFEVICRDLTWEVVKIPNKSQNGIIWDIMGFYGRQWVLTISSQEM